MSTNSSVTPTDMPHLMIGSPTPGKAAELVAVKGDLTELKRVTFDMKGGTAHKP